jgi:hypothetical protein
LSRCFFASDDIRIRDEEEWDEVEEGSCASEVEKERLLEYFTSRVIHQVKPSFVGKSAFRYEPSSGFYDLSSYLRAIDCDAESISFEADKTYSQVREIAKKSPLVTRNGIFSLNDVVQEVMCIIRRQIKE